MKNNNAKTILCLVNSAAFSRSYFEQLAPYLRSHGYHVHFALDSHLSDYLHAGGKALPDGEYFTDYLKSYGVRSTNASHTDTKWETLFSDFDRWMTFDLAPPSEACGKIRYQDIPQQLAEFFYDIFEKISPAAVLYEPVSNSFALSAYHACQSYNIPFLSISPSRIPGRIEISATGALKDDITIGNLKRELEKSGISAEIENESMDYIKYIDNKIPDYMISNGLDDLSLIRKYANFEKFIYFYNVFKYSLRQKSDWSYAYQHGNPVKLSVAYVRRAILRKLRLIAVKKMLESPIPDENYLVYPLHFHPEASTSILAPDYVDEFSAIRSIAFRLPTSMKLYVKEHPSAFALQNLSFYKKLNRLPNVRLLNPSINMKTLIRNSQGVVTLTSTAGFEGAVLNKPVLAFGNVFYKYFGNVREITCFEDIDNGLNWISSYNPLPENEIINSVAAYFKFTSPGKFDFKQSLGDTPTLAGVATLVHKTLSDTLSK